MDLQNWRTEYPVWKEKVFSEQYRSVLMYWVQSTKVLEFLLLLGYCLMTQTRISGFTSACNRTGTR